jgi:hypothetical protein
MTGEYTDEAVWEKVSKLANPLVMRSDTTFEVLVGTDQCYAVPQVDFTSHIPGT